MRILIAEDDLTSRTLLAAVLRKFGHEVTVTEDGGAAWAALQRPDAPRCASRSGVDCGSAERRRPPSTSAIAWS